MVKSCEPSFFNGKVLPSDGSESLVHVLHESRHDEEAGFEPLGMGIGLPLQ